MLRLKEIGQILLLAFSILNKTEQRSIQSDDQVDGGITSVSQGHTKHSFSLTPLLGENRFDYHMFGCNCHPVMECVHDSDCHTSKGHDYYCEFQCCSFKCLHVSYSHDEAVVDTVTSTEPQSVEVTMDTIPNFVSDEDHDEENYKGSNHSEPGVDSDVLNAVDELPIDNVSIDVFDISETVQPDRFIDTDMESEKADADETKEGFMSNGKYRDVYGYKVGTVIGTRDQVHDAKTKDNIDKHATNTDQVHEQKRNKDSNNEFVDKINTGNEASGNTKNRTGEQVYKHSNHDVGNRANKKGTTKHPVNKEVKDDRNYIT